MVPRKIKTQNRVWLVNVGISIKSEINIELSNIIQLLGKIGACGLMDKASDFGSEDCRIESCDVRNMTFDFPNFKMKFYVSSKVK